ncbi:hypothetical protein [Pseudomonas sp. URIL14HWK12:I6]|uniref:hypothetical protein n=1 Tax=Pseudomonas sp. URIL14HWK12:I6 TaxID=1283293 RepID=UPI00210E682C|nr:hypothetical protein [Pseudomonas sp. URIL14HWK12:I6]
MSRLISPGTAVLDSHQFGGDPGFFLGEEWPLEFNPLAVSHMLYGPHDVSANGPRVGGEICGIARFSEAYVV